MDLKLLTYLLYLGVTVPLTVGVARTLYRNGRVFLHDSFDGNAALAESVNHLLVVGFYLLNLGWVALFLSTDATIDTGQAVLEVLSRRIGVVAVVLGLVHLMNVWAFNTVRRRAAERRLVTAPVPADRTVAVPAFPRPQ